MSWIFYNCQSLKELNISNFNTNNVTDMLYMFRGCCSLKELNFSNFNTDKVTKRSGMLYGCSEQLIFEIKTHYKNIKAPAFY